MHGAPDWIETTVTAHTGRRNDLTGHVLTAASGGGKTREPLARVKGQAALGLAADSELRHLVSMPATIRPARPADVPAIQAIYAQHVTTGTGSFELTPPDEAEIAVRMAKVAARGWPWLVAVDGADVVQGYAYAGPFRERLAYNHTVEDSVYVAPAATGQGLGRALLEAVMAQCKASGASEMLAVIGDSENHASIGLHKALGFADAGVLRGVGLKFGRILDVVILQKKL
jgi:L-amino acid N-acyltransferase YncA